MISFIAANSMFCLNMLVAFLMAVHGWYSKSEEFFLESGWHPVLAWCGSVIVVMIVSGLVTIVLLGIVYVLVSIMTSGGVVML